MMSTRTPVTSPEAHDSAGDSAVADRAFLQGFALPSGLEATGPIEATGQSRDSVRMQVASASLGIIDTSFRKIGDYLDAGDVLVVNNSATLAAAVRCKLGDRDLLLHIAVPIANRERDIRVVEARNPHGISSEPFHELAPGDTVTMPGRATAHIIEPLTHSQNRLWIARLTLPNLSLVGYLNRFGEPIRYSYVSDRWPIQHYQTVFARKPGSSEMPSAGRAFSRDLVRTLRAKKVRIVPITLHTGVSSLESHEPPYPEPYLVSRAAAGQINRARRTSKKVVAVGTTVVRTLETVGTTDGIIRAGAGFTDLVIHPDHKIKTIDGLLTGWHEPEASHLFMLEAIAGHHLLARSYKEGITQGFFWHEFGDMQLILAPRRSVD